MKRFLLSALLLFSILGTRAQTLDFRNAYFIDMLNSMMLTPSIGYERYYDTSERPKSLIFTLSYNIAMSKEMGILIPPSSDRTGMEMSETGFQDDWYGHIFQGPGIKVNFSSGKSRRGNIGYFAPGLGLKMLWYNDVTVLSDYYYGDSYYGLPKNYRVQSEFTPTLIPELTFGKKWIKKRMFFDGFVGLRCSILFRNKNISEQVVYDYGTMGKIETVTHPGYVFEVTPKPWFALGLRLGFVH